MIDSIETTGPNAEQIEFWNGEAGAKWSDFNPQLDRMLAPLGAVVIDRAAPASGEQVLDVGCGCGDTALELARRVAPVGAVTGIDISSPMLAVARRRAEEANLAVTLLNADAETHALDAESFDLAFSRFGVMFFNNPEAAFTNINRALRPGGRLIFACWQAVAHNPWVSLPLDAVRPLVPDFVAPDPEAPGPFAFADGERVAGILSAAGFSDVALDSHQSAMNVGEGDLDACVESILKLGPVSRMLREADEATMAAAATAVGEAVAPCHTGDTLKMDSAVWIVSGRR
jgi:SAM-dependent methyltransferase